MINPLDPCDYTNLDAYNEALLKEMKRISTSSWLGVSQSRQLRQYIAKSPEHFIELQAACPRLGEAAVLETAATTPPEPEPDFSMLLLPTASASSTKPAEEKKTNWLLYGGLGAAGLGVLYVGYRLFSGPPKRRRRRVR